MISVSWLISLYYNVIIAYAIFFFFASMTTNLPWAGCNNEWNTDLCITAEISANYSKNWTAYLYGKLKFFCFPLIF